MTSRESEEECSICMCPIRKPAKPDGCQVGNIFFRGTNIFLGTQCFGYTIFWIQNVLGTNIFLGTRTSWWNFWIQNFFGTKIFSGYKTFWLQHFLRTNIFSGYTMFWVQNFWTQNVLGTFLGTNIFLGTRTVHETLGSKIFLVQIFFWVPKRLGYTIYLGYKYFSGYKMIFYKHFWFVFHSTCFVTNHAWRKVRRKILDVRFVEVNIERSKRIEIKMENGETK